MNRRAILILFLFLLWSVGSGWFYICKIKQKCDLGTKAISNTTPLKFDYNSEVPQTTANFAAFKENILAKLGATNKLSIIGNYGNAEVNNSTFDNLGVARASAVRNLFPEIDDSRFVLGSKQIELDSLLSNDKKTELRLSDIEKLI